MKLRMVLGLAVVLSVISACSHKAPQVNYDVPPAIDLSRNPDSSLEGTPWTDWAEKWDVAGWGPGLLVLSHIRERMLKENLHDPNVNISYALDKTVNCPKPAKFRTADGTCTDPNNPLAGAAGVAFGRNVPPEFIDNEAEEKLLYPNPSLVSKEFFTRDEFKPVPFLNMIAAVWIQFMNHDWLTHGANNANSKIRFQGANGKEEVVERTKGTDLNRSRFKAEYSKVTQNDVTHWWDASQIYGSNQTDQNALRTFSTGKMKTVMVNGNETMPTTALNVAYNRQNQGHELTGFRDNWWVGLSMLHTLFVKEHNRIADMLYKKNVKPGPAAGTYLWTRYAGDKPEQMDAKTLDETLFQTARLVNSAILAKIHTVEWTPAILPHPVLKRGMCANWYGAANPNCWSTFLKHFPALAKTDFFKEKEQSFIISGIVGGKRNDNAVPFSITEEFTSVYRLHSLLPENIELKTVANPKSVRAIPFLQTRNEFAYDIISNNSLKDLYYSFGTQMPGQLVNNNFPAFMQNLTIPGLPNMDLGMVDVLRDRERGVPRYNQFRRGIGLKPITSYRDFFPPKKKLNAEQQEKLAKFYRVYGRVKDENGQLVDNVEAIDLLVGTLSEEVRPTKNYKWRFWKQDKFFGFGETMFQIFILMASRRLMADPYFTDYYNKDYYTEAGLKYIDSDGTLAKVILHHMPELAPKLKGLDTAFAPWKD